MNLIVVPLHNVDETITTRIGRRNLRIRNSVESLKFTISSTDVRSFNVAFVFCEKFILENVFKRCSLRGIGFYVLLFRSTSRTTESLSNNCYVFHPRVVLLKLSTEFHPPIEVLLIHSLPQQPPL